MYCINIEKTLNVPIEALWAILADFTNLSWYEGPEKVEAIGEGIGQIRRVTMPGMPEPIDEVLEAIDHQAHSLRYSIPVNDSMIMQDFSVDVSLHAKDDGRVEAHWLAQFSGIVGELLPPEQMIEIMEQTYGAMLDALEQAAKQ